MVENQLTIDDVQIIIESLEHARTAFENTQYPPGELRQLQLQRVNSALTKMRHVRDQLKAPDKREAEGDE
jgi:hypothetical protein